MKAKLTKPNHAPRFPQRSPTLDVLLILLTLLSPTRTAIAVTRHVDANSANPSPPYANWATAAVNIQDAVDAAAAGDEIVVTNGLYAGGGRAAYGTMTNRVAVTKPITVRSVNGPRFTVIQGYQLPGTIIGYGAIRCVYLTNGASLTGFTLTQGGTRTSGDSIRERSGGGLLCESTSAVAANCLLVANAAENFGGGARGGTLNNCLLTGNSAYAGGGASLATLNNCTLTGNSAKRGSGSDSGALNNCIIYFNRVSTNYFGGTFNYCCATPLPASGTNNISADPQLASAACLSASSPCRGAGSASFATGTDIDGEAWASPPSMGCDEYYPGVVAGPLSVSLEASPTTAAAGYPISLTGTIEGRTTRSIWEFGDGSTTTNQPWTSHVWTAPGDYAVVLRAFNDGSPGGVSATELVHVITTPMHHVATGSASPSPPYTNWATAAQSIQDAVDVATIPGAVVLVSNGVYATGGRAVSGSLTNRVAVTKPLNLRSVNGPQVTLIQGRQLPGTIYGNGAIRCVYLTNDASLSGFTLTNGATLGSGATSAERYGGGLYCAGTEALVSNCVLAGNAAHLSGGGAYSGTLNNCTLSGNSARDSGGGAYSSALSNSLLSNNSAASGGGAFAAMLNNCVLAGNFASETGGGAADSMLNNCALTGNSASASGGGAYRGALNNCTLTANSSGYGGGVFNSAANNCIVYFNSAPNYSSGSLNYCCTTPLPTTGTNNLAMDPQLASAFHVSAASPCRGAGSARFASGTDIDGEEWAIPASIGCDEFRSGSVTGPLRVEIRATITNIMVGYPVELTALIEGRTTASVWQFGDGITASNQPFVTHSWAAPGDYAVNLRAFNESQPLGLNATVTIHVAGPTVHYVAANSLHPVAPYASWATAAAAIEDAVAEAYGGSVVLVTNGTYYLGAQLMIDRGFALASVNGPAGTIIDGSRLGSNGCARLDHAEALLAGFTITGGNSRTNGGGVWCAKGMVSNCFITLNRAANRGGGVHFESGGEMCDSIVTSNSSADGGGVAFDNGGTVRSCVLSGNNAFTGGAVFCAGAGLIIDSLIYSNTASNNGGGVYCRSGGGIYTCEIRDNTAQSNGGGVYADLTTIRSCLIAGNRAAQIGGGIYSDKATLYNCTIVANHAPFYASGLYLAAGTCQTVQNCIVWDNSGTPTNVAGPLAVDSFNCVQGWSGGGTVITSDPRFTQPEAGDFHLRVGSPVIDRGTNATWMSTAIDLDGQARILGAQVDFGAYELGRLTAGFFCTPTLGIAPMAVSVNGYATGTNSASAYFLWDVDGDGNIDRHGLASNSFVHTFTLAGLYSVGLIVTNNGSESATVVRTNYLTVQAPVVAQFDAAPLSGLWPLTVQFTDRSENLPGHWSWDFNHDGTADSTERNPAYTYWTPGVYSVSLLVSNNLGAGGSSSDQITKTNLITVNAAVHSVHYIAPSGHHLQPFMSWADAATNFVDGVSAASDGDTVLVAEGNYGITQEVRLTHGVLVKSLAGAEMTIIENQAENRVFWISHSNAVVDGFTITKGYAHADYEDWPTNCGGGVFIGEQGTLLNCRIVGNGADRDGGGVSAYLGGTVSNCWIADNWAGWAGGADLSGPGRLECCVIAGNWADHLGGGLRLLYGGTARNCLVLENGCDWEGGGAHLEQGTALENCTIVDNWTPTNAFFTSGSGVHSDDSQTLIRNCIIWANTDSPNLVVQQGVPTNLAYNCIQDWRGGGTAIITNNPRFSDASSDNYRLRFDSPCIDTGTALTGTTHDLDGHPRLWDGNQDGTALFDLGCYEYDPVSGFRIIAIVAGPPVQVFFPSSSNRLYSLQSRMSLAVGGWTNLPDQTDIPGRGGLDALSDTRSGFSNRFYRIQVKPR